MKVAVSFISSRLNLEDTIKEINNTNADYLHIDVMDGIFVKTKNFDLEQLQSIINLSTKKNDVHLMCQEPIPYIEYLAKLNVDAITIHREIENVLEAIKTIKKHGIKVGLAINPETKVEDIKEYLELVDIILIMSVTPGSGGQPFMLSNISKIKELKEYQELFNYEIYIDGGINGNTIKLVKGVNTVISGSYICKGDNYQTQIDGLR